MTGSLVEALEQLRSRMGEVRLPLPGPEVDQARIDTAYVVNQLDDYVLPRLRDLDAPLLAVVGGSTGSGKSTLVNGLIGEPVTTPGVLRPTTRHPVLVVHPNDGASFASDRVLPRLPRVTTGEGLAGAGELNGVRLVSRASLPEGLGLLDAPDLDSVAHANRDLAGLLMAAADLWIFVTTAARYADAVPWHALRAAVARHAAVVIVLNRVPPEAVAEVSTHVQELLDAEGLADAPLFVIAETTLQEGMLPVQAVEPLQTWLWSLAADAATRAAVARRTLAGAVADLLARSEVVAAAAAGQTDVALRLHDEAAGPYERAVTAIVESAQDGSVLRGEVLARWQEFVGTGEYLKKLETGVGRLRDRMSAAFRGEPARTEKVSEAIEGRLASMIIAQAHDAARRADSNWRSDPAGRAALAGDDLARASADIADRAAAAVRAWQDDVLDLIRAEGADKRQTARLLAYGVNGAAVVLMVAVFSATGGLTGAEIGIAGASTVLAQKVLEAVFGEGAVRRMSEVAIDALRARVQTLMDAQQARFDERLEALELDPGVAGTIQQAVLAARSAEWEPGEAQAALPPGPHARPAADAVPAHLEPVLDKPRWRDRMRSWWYGEVD